MARISLAFSAIVMASAATMGAAGAQAQAIGPTREQVQPPAPAVEEQGTGQANVNEREAFAPGACPLSSSDVNIAIREVRFTAPGGGELAPELATLLAGIRTSSETQPIRVVCDLRDQANVLLRLARYVAVVQIPPQRIDDGVLRLEVVSGHIVEVRVRGDAGPYEDTLKARIEQLKAMSPLNAGEAERLLMLANDVPGLSVQLGLSPSVSSGKPGDLVGELRISYRRVSVIANVQNYNSELLGRETAYLRAEYYSLFGLNDRTFIAGSATFDLKKQLVVQVGQSFGIGSNGDRLSLIGTLAQSRPKLDALDLRTISMIGNIEYTHTLVRTVAAKVELSGGFEYAQQRTRVFGTGASVPLNRDRISTLYLRLDGEERKLRFNGSQKWSLAGTLEVRKGLDIFGATKPGSVVDGYTPTRFNGTATGTVIRGEISGTIGFGPIFELATTLRGQWSDKQLLNYDQFSLGNLTIGRGYDPGSNTGDRAIAGAHEIRANVPLTRNLGAQVYGFYDWVHLWNLDPVSTERNRTLQSVGGGARFTLAQGMRLDLTYAHPLDPPLLTGQNIRRAPDRFMFSLTTQLIPFGALR